MTHAIAIGCPLAIKILLHYGNRTDEPPPNVGAPAVQDEINRLLAIGALMSDGYAIHITSLGLAWIEELCRVELPAGNVTQKPRPTFELSFDGKAITCLRCGMTSGHPQDVEHHYCGKCHIFHDDIARTMSDPSYFGGERKK